MAENTARLSAALGSTRHSDEDWAIRLGFYIHDASRLRRIVYDTALKPLGVTRSQAWVIAYLSRQDGMPQSELAAQLADVGHALAGVPALLPFEDELDALFRRVGRAPGHASKDRRQRDWVVRPSDGVRRRTPS